MSIADKNFINAVNHIRDNGFDDYNYNIRPVWGDGTPAHTKKVFCYITRYDLQKEFPILTLRKQAFKSCVKEILWIWQKKSNVVEELGAHFWDSWALEDGTIGKAYGYQAGKKYNFKEGYMDQVDLLLWKLKNNPMDRRMIVSFWNNDDLEDMALAPCAFQTIWDVSDGKLNLTLIQRSGDLVAAAGPGCFNEIQYSILQHMIAQVSNLEVGEFVHIVNNLHIYDRHEEVVDKFINNEQHNAPRLWINPEVKDFYDFTIDDIKLIDYNYSDGDIKFEVAV